MNKYKSLHRIEQITAQEKLCAGQIDPASLCEKQKESRGAVSSQYHQLIRVVAKLQHTNPVLILDCCRTRELIVWRDSNGLSA